MTPFKRCYRFNRCAYILYNGDMIPCCADWSRSYIVGNVCEQTIKQVWDGERLGALRENFRSGNYAQLPEMCRNCKRTNLAARSHRNLTGLYQRCLSMLSGRVRG